ncbi:MAG: hypothetical protein HRT73_15455, partial [Flavobacteriales bacterium]|nr:hypothetical protein [Flavobacteriales bacterium]
MENYCNAQNFADKDYYLVDSLVLEELAKSDKELLENSLKLYHKAKDDTSKINSLTNICENMIHHDWSKYQFFQYDLIKKAINSYPPIQTKKSLLTSLAFALVNIGIIRHNQGNFSEAL